VHDAPCLPHPSKLLLDQLVPGVDALVSFWVSVVEGPGPLLEGSADQAEPQAVADAVAYLRRERWKPCLGWSRTSFNHRVALCDAAAPNPPAAFRQQWTFLTFATVPFYLGYL